MTTTRIGAALLVDNDTGEIISASVGDKALLAAAADAVGIEVNSTTGKLQIKTAGAALANGVQRDELSRFAGAILRGALATGDGIGGIFELTNTYGSDLIASVRILITTLPAGACTVDVGVGSPAAIRDNILDGLNMLAPPGGAAPSCYSSLSAKHTGANGQGEYVWPNQGLLHASVSAGAAAGLVGTYEVVVRDIT